MKKLIELAAGLIVIFGVSKLGITKADEYRAWYSAVRTFMDPLDLKKKSCPDGFVEDVDYVIVSGVVNVTDIGHPPLDGMVLVFYQEGVGLTYIPESEYRLGKEPCANVQRVPSTSCRCLAQDAQLIRVKCNITMKTEYHRSIFVLAYFSKRMYPSGASERLPNVYADKSCSTGELSAKNQGASLLAMSDLAIMLTAFVISVLSSVWPMISTNIG